MARFDPYNEQSLTKLRGAMTWSKQKTLPFRQAYMTAMRYYVGDKYGEDGNDYKTPLNLFRLGIDIYARSLAAQNPQVTALTFDRSIKAKALYLEAALNNLLRELELSYTVREAVKSALFMMGVVKVGICSSDEASVKGWSYEAGQPYAENVLFDDFLCDMTARRAGEWDWCGNRYRVPYEFVMESNDFDKEGLKAIPHPSGSSFSEDTVDDERSHVLSQGSGPLKEEYREHIELWDLWLPNDQLLITLPVEGNGPPLKVIEWDGPRNGPFHCLTFGEVPGNLMPAPPTMSWIDAHELTNRLFCKLGRQAERAKTLTLASGGAVANKDAERVTDAEDGQVLRVDDPSSVKEVQYGKIDPSNLAFTMQLKDLFSYIAGNIDSLGGLSPQADTLGQEKMIRGQSSQLMEEMSDRVITFVTGIVRDLAYYVYTDPVSEVPLSIRIPGYTNDVNVTWKPKHREQPFHKFNLRIEPFSMQAKSPASRLQTILTIVSQVIMPFAPQMQQQGKEVDVEALLEVVSKYADAPEVADFVRNTAIPLALPGGAPPPTASSAAPPSSGVGKPNGSYTRTNVSAGQPSQGMDLMKAAMKSAGGQ